MPEKAERFARILVPSLGLSFLWPYFRASYLTFLTSFDIQAAATIQAAYGAYAVAFLLAALVAIACPRYITAFFDSPKAGPCLLACGVAGNAALWLAAGPFAPAICTVASIAAVVFFVGSVTRYGIRLAAWEARDTALVGFLSLGICFLDNAALTLGEQVSEAFCLLAPVLSVLCTPKTEKVFDGTLKANGQKAGQTPSTALVVLMVLLALFCIGGNVVRGITSPWFSYAGTTERSLYMTLSNMVLAGVSLVFLCRGSNVRKVLFWNWTLLMALFFLGLVLLAFAGGGIARLGSDIATVSRVCFTLLMLLFALDSRRFFATEIVRLLGLFLLLPEALAALIRHVAVPALLAHLGTDPLAIASYAGVVVIFVLSVAIVAALGMLLLRQVGEEKPETQGALEENALGADTAAADPMSELVRTYGLTAREADSASLVSKGYSLEKTAELLGISINTVRTHMRSVYGKLEIHSRQELIDLLDSLRSS